VDNNLIITVVVTLFVVAAVAMYFSFRSGQDKEV
jgi:hypothetical protein